MLLDSLPAFPGLLWAPELVFLELAKIPFSKTKFKQGAMLLGENGASDLNR